MCVRRHEHIAEQGGECLVEEDDNDLRRGKPDTTLELRPTPGREPDTTLVPARICASGHGVIRDSGPENTGG